MLLERRLYLLIFFYKYDRDFLSQHQSPKLYTAAEKLCSRLYTPYFIIELLHIAEI
jgi:hypothetical protein